ncbi:MAG: hypothetical protein EP333_07810 [Bacteroidetes bacterium]|nr:MAG: hypothetical protein EP333_07810 [Bacteroidota bacterium]
MKKSILAVAVVLGASATFAQDLTSKKGEDFLPASGDWAISIDATPFLNYAGNLIGGNGANVSPTWNYLVGDQRIVGKYFAADDMAYRAGLRIGMSSSSGSAMVGDDGVTTAPVYPATPSMVEDSYKMSSTRIGLSGGLEWRRGFGRLQGFYGGELGIMLGSDKTTYSYGNAMTTTGATTANFGANLANDPYYGTPSRITEAKGGSMFGLGLRGFIGAEYFVLPRIAIGGEFGWGLMFGSTGASSTSYEGTDGTNVGTVVEEGTKSSGFSLDTDGMNSVFGPAASLRMTFHF